MAKVGVCVHASVYALRFFIIHSHIFHTDVCAILLGPVLVSFLVAEKEYH